MKLNPSTVLASVDRFKMPVAPQWMWFFNYTLSEFLQFLSMSTKIIPIWNLLWQEGLWWGTLCSCSSMIQNVGCGDAYMLPIYSSTTIWITTVHISEIILPRRCADIPVVNLRSSKLLLVAKYLRVTITHWSSGIASLIMVSCFSMTGLTADSNILKQFTQQLHMG